MIINEPKNQQQLLQLPPTGEHLAGFDYAHSRHSAKIPNGVKPEDLLVPSFWAHHALKMKPLDEIRAHAEDGTWVAYLLVLDCSRTWVKVKQLGLHFLGTADVALTQASEADVDAFKAQHEVKHRGPHAWSIVRKADGAVLEQGIKVKDEAIAWLDKHARDQVGGAAVKTPAPTPATA